MITPGKWIAEKPNTSTGWWHISSHHGGFGDVATCFCEDAEDNALLIAAAPDLYEALKSVIASAEDIHPGMLRAKVQIYHADLVKIKAALAKAEGR